MADKLQVFCTVALMLPLLCLLSACSGRVGPTAVILPVPSVLQTDRDDCGVAAATALLRYHGLELPPERRQHWRARAEEASGLPAAELVTLLQEQGCQTWLYSGDLDSPDTGLVPHLHGRRPVLVMIGGRDRPSHYVLVIGHDPVHGSVVLADPVRGRVSMRQADFLDSWEICQRLSILAVPGG